MKSRFQLLVRCGLLSVFAMTASCVPKDKNNDDKGSDADHKVQDTDAPASEDSASFDDSKGLKLKEETKQALGLKFAPVTSASLKGNLSLRAEVYREATEPVFAHTREQAGSAYATALLSPQDAAKLTPGQKSSSQPEAYVWRIADTLQGTTGQVEALLRLPHFSGPVGSFVDVTFDIPGPAKMSLCVPSSAVLRTSGGVFVYVQRGDYLERVEVKLGSETNGSVEIATGLRPEDMVLSSPVQEVYLIELRLTKGGGDD